MTQAIQYSQTGGPEVLSLNEVPTPTPGPGQVLVRVEAVGVNPVDGKIRSGLRASPPFTGPRGLGEDGAGTVLALGDGVEALRVGDPVAFSGAGGAYATETVVDAAGVYPRPAAVSPAQGAAIGIPAGTAYQVVRSLAVTGADTVLVHAGSGAVGQAVIQFARLLGARVIATSSERRAHRVTDLGATQVAYGDGLLERVRTAAPDGITVAIDCAGTDEAIDVSLELVTDRSRIATIVRGAEAAGWGIRAWRGGSPVPMTDAEVTLRREAIPVTLALLAAGAFHVELGRTFPLTDAGKAQEELAAGADGKLILVP
ncbi:quinone oxidoreductase family protein [Microbacterium gorillae]|uniref:quinone oxidoreductase family protein n=1 Tax=Microbacterium gorillae TaxID=1231063 RepID=UPI00058FAD72|nr:NADP-dependent oxidoreductase [Microbacterium gorillae]